MVEWTICTCNNHSCYHEKGVGSGTSGGRVMVVRRGIGRGKGGVPPIRVGGRSGAIVVTPSDGI